MAVTRSAIRPITLALVLCNFAFVLLLTASYVYFISYCGWCPFLATSFAKVPAAILVVRDGGCGGDLASRNNRKPALVAAHRWTICPTHSIKVIERRNAYNVCSLLALSDFLAQH